MFCFNFILTILKNSTVYMAEGVGFEPTVGFILQFLSREPESATLSALHSNLTTFKNLTVYMAGRVGFEPTDDFIHLWFSRPVF